MKTETIEVKSKGEVVSTIDIQQFDSVDEAVAALGDATCLNLLNRQHKADESNKERAKFRPDTASKKSQRQAALDHCTKDPSLQAEMQAKVTEGMDSFYAFLDHVWETELAK